MFMFKITAATICSCPHVSSVGDFLQRIREEQLESKKYSIQIKEKQQSMSSRVDRGGEGGRGKVFLSAHRCPEVDVLPYHNSEAQIPQQCSPVPAEKSPEFTSTGRSEADYLDISSTCCSEEEEQEEEEAEGIISDWSEEDLSLHFSPSVILPSDDEESDTESSFKCIEVTVETQVSFIFLLM